MPDVGAPGRQELHARLLRVDEILADLPQVHVGGVVAEAPGGVWNTAASCYRFLAERYSPGFRTLETGLGVSTALFASWGADHTCVVPFQEEVDALVSYCRERGISTDSVRFITRSSHEVLPELADDGDLDLVLVDGLHGFPAAVIDWFYACSRLRRGGTVIIDDADLASVALGLRSFLDADPRWQLLRDEGKWRAYERLSSGSLGENWTEQGFLRTEPNLLRRTTFLGRQLLHPVAERLRRMRNGSPA